MEYLIGIGAMLLLLLLWFAAGGVGALIMYGLFLTPEAPISPTKPYEIDGNKFDEPFASLPALGEQISNEAVIMSGWHPTYDDGFNFL